LPRPPSSLTCCLNRRSRSMADFGNHGRQIFERTERLSRSRKNVPGVDSNRTCAHGIRLCGRPLRLVSRSVWNQPFKSRVRPYGPSFWFGTALIILGVLVNGFSARNYFRVVQDLSRGVQRIE
jgi:hypothetical protein